MLDYIKQQIIESSCKYITYADFIEAALYHPKHGYYVKETVKIGREGDFYTTSNVSDIYGRMLSKWYQKQVTELGLPATVCEIGAGTGRFAKAFIEEWNENMSNPLAYTMVEKSVYHRKVQNETLAAISEKNVRQIEKLEEIKPFDGLVFSNELFDALPVHVVQKVNNQLYEIVVAIVGDKLVEKLIPLEDKLIQKFMIENQIILQESQRMEIPLSMVDMIHAISEFVRSGIIVTVDYGYTREDWMNPSRKAGSLRGFHKHQLIDNVLLNPGDMDITSHVHFDALIEIGENVGLSFIQKFRQDEFLLTIGILEELQERYDTNPFSETSKRNRAIRSLILPTGISPFFHIILQTKGLKEKGKQLIIK